MNSAVFECLKTLISGIICGRVSRLRRDQGMVVVIVKIGNRPPESVDCDWDEIRVFSRSELIRSLMGDPLLAATLQEVASSIESVTVAAVERGKVPAADTSHLLTVDTTIEELVPVIPSGSRLHAILHLRQSNKATTTGGESSSHSTITSLCADHATIMGRA